MELTVVAPTESGVQSRFYNSLSSTQIPWIESPFFDKLIDNIDLPSEDKALIRSYADNGYVVIDPELSDEDIDQTILDCEGRYDLNPDGREARVQDAWKFSEPVGRIASSPKVLRTLELLYQRAPIPFQTLNFKYGTEQPTHSDTIHFQSIPANFMCGVWVALEDVDERNGALHYYPKSHRLPLYDLHHLGLPASVTEYPHYEQFVQALFGTGKFEKHVVRMKKGEALIWAANLFHGGNPILERDRTRYSQVTHYYFDGCMYYSPLLSKPHSGQTYFRTDNLVDIRTGQVIPHYFNGQRVKHEGAAIVPRSLDAPSLRRALKLALLPMSAALLVSNGVLLSKLRRSKKAP